MNAKRINHSNSFNSSISGSTSKNSFKENTNTSLNMKSTKSDKILIAKTGISDKLNPLSKHKQVQKVDSRVQQKYPFEEKYTII